jgi:FkbM family methyltransferase
MGKWRTALSLLASGSLLHFRRRLRYNLRKHRLRRAGRRPFVYRVNGFHGFPFVCVPGLSESEDTFLTGELDRLELALICDWLAPGDAFIDVGANLGLYTFCTHHHLSGHGTFLAIEASLELARGLKASAQLLGVRDVLIEQVAAGDAAKEIVFYVAPPGKPTGEQSLHPDPIRSADYVPHRIRMSPLTEITGRYPAAAQPAAVKLDIEGAEPLALRGAPAAWFTLSGPLWIVELNPPVLARAGSSCAAIVDFFPAAAFELQLVPQFAKTGARHLPVRPLVAGESFSDAWFYNLIAIPHGRPFAARRQRIARHFTVD